MLRFALLVLSIASVAAALLARAQGPADPYAWPALLAAFVFGVAAQWGVTLPGTAQPGDAGPPSSGRRRAGIALALAGAAAFGWGTWVLVDSWATAFDGGWLAWLAGTCLLAIGLDLATARWQRPPAPGVVAAGVAVAVITAVALVLRFGTFAVFPAESHITQIEELQVGGMGMAYLNGWRHRWEYLSHTWLGALGIWLGGPSLMAMRAPFTLLSGLKVIPLFLWLRFAVGNTGAVVGSLLLAFSAWDVTFARVPTNQNTLISAAVFALLCGPALRDRPSAFVWLGFSSGFVLYEYVVYRAVALYALGGAWLVAAGRRGAGWLRRVSGPMLATALCLVMAFTLLQYLQKTGLAYQYFDGWGRAKAQGAYYNEQHTWQDSVGKRVERVQRAVGLFFFSGDESPVRNPTAKPVTDPVTATLILLGVAYGVANPLRRGAGLAVGALLTTLAGTLVITGNFDPVRAGGAVAFLYGVAGYGAAAVLEIFAALGRFGRRLGQVVLALAVVAAAVHSLDFLREFTTSPLIRRNQFRDLAFVSGWLGQNVSDDTHTVAVVPGFTYLFEINDATWMRGVRTQGTAHWDVASALEKLQARREPSMIFVFAGRSTHAVLGYLRQILPGVDFRVHPGPNSPDNDIGYGLVAALPADFASDLERARCRYAEASFRLFADGAAPVLEIDTRLPFVDASTWPQEIQGNVYRLGEQMRELRADFFGRFRVEKGGRYRFEVETHPGGAEVFVDGAKLATQFGSPLDLAPGPHRIEVRAKYQRGAFPVARILWQGPDSNDVVEPLPFYRAGICEQPGGGPAEPEGGA